MSPNIEDGQMERSNQHGSLAESNERVRPYKIWLFVALAVLECKSKNRKRRDCSIQLSRL